MISSGSIGVASIPPVARIVTAWLTAHAPSVAAASRGEQSRYSALRLAVSFIVPRPSGIAKTAGSVSDPLTAWHANSVLTSARGWRQRPARLLGTYRRQRRAVQHGLSSITLTRGTSSARHSARNVAALAQLRARISITTSRYACGGFVARAIAPGIHKSRNTAPLLFPSSAVKRWEQYTGQTAVLDG